MKLSTQSIAPCRKSAPVARPLPAALAVALLWTVGTGCSEGTSTPPTGGSGGSSTSTSATGGTGGEGGDVSTTGGTGGSSAGGAGGEGGSAGATSTSSTSATSTSSTSATSGTGGGSGNNLCQQASDQILAKYMECGIQVRPGGGDPPECTPALGAQSICVAQCTDQASCETLKGEDSEGAVAYAECLGGC
jgi:hypothetical protein